MPQNIRTSAPDTETAIDRTVPDFPVAESLDEDNYFKTNIPPPYLKDLCAEAEQFVQIHEKTGRKVVLVTSGGTTVPLENNTVRFIDNFSAGTRGATSAEYFLENGYAVIFLHREFSLLPYSRHYSHTTNCFLDYMTEIDGKLEINPKYSEQMHKVWKKYNDARDQNLLLLLPFTTVTQYLFSLKEISKILDKVGTRALFYLAAAVSDFFLPHSKLPEHKIQAQDHNGGKLVVNLDPVPKFLRRLVDSWAPGAMITSFKLETDKSILIKKANQALDRYNHQLVIGNLLQTRKKEVVFVSKNYQNDPVWYRLSDEDVAKGVDIESLIIPAVIKEHQEWIAIH
ncbi:hypothetical protein WICANDRAFT_63580 [Wickerhamomyces anomalus NRRL Y-366-8]|uniref:DNA/pantothenate metabolism flavoprotein C-terminal domain-containing protein n=1 Tax=Wickerhamomyces anomalus (strain ATCC 58044 / CBS 1984 / NCYC 433 / NRRL Y-366-8) TaxID=683960 RepID=A0A1E3P171_WICAA|nr:uncharacterized protein WICANDRAFT_63580 [Wickerhamomyces anomalus NRRL Y-366-8]ODQ59078.1 hypothetical protein WICANDRAFT_63580 [Wickerhamomyces anomalus NRRL Y-366-8]